MRTAPTPAVSILLPVRDAAKTLALCLRSIERQSLRDFECVIVDDGSDDASPEIAATFARRPFRATVRLEQQASSFASSEP